MYTNKKEVFKINGNWDRHTKQLKVKYPQLTNLDLYLIPGEEEKLLERIGKKINKNREDVISIIDGLNHLL